MTTTLEKSLQTEVQLLSQRVEHLNQTQEQMNLLHSETIERVVASQEVINDTMKESIGEIKTAVKELSTNQVKMTEAISNMNALQSEVNRATESQQMLDQRVDTLEKQQIGQSSVIESIESVKGWVLKILVTMLFGGAMYGYFSMQHKPSTLNESDIKSIISAIKESNK